MKSSDIFVASSESNGLAILIGASAVAAVGTVIIATTELGPLSTHMAVHIATMNVAAPLAAFAWRLCFAGPLAGSKRARLLLTTLSQIGLLWTLHSPAIHQIAQSSPLAAMVLHLALSLAALAFWISIVDASSSRWQAILALLVSGKFACLLGALLIFAPRLLFEPLGTAHGLHVHHLSQPAALADQHLAGLLMVAACPLSYVLAAVVLAAQALFGLRRMPPATYARASFAGR